MLLVKIQLCSLLLNEEEWLLKNYEQHKNWPGLTSWVFVHGADFTYGNAAPHMTTKEGLSVDNTRNLLDHIATDDPRVKVIHHGWMRHERLDQAKCHGRNRYLRVADEVKPDWLVIADLDEFYTLADQEKITHLLGTVASPGAVVQQRHVWYPPSLSGSRHSLFHAEVVGAYWSVPHCRLWRWHEGMVYSNDHNWPIPQGQRLARLSVTEPQCIHMGFASDKERRHAKHRYYRARGEGRGDGRQMSVACRQAWELWKPGEELPWGAKVVPYYGPVPEVFA